MNFQLYGTDFHSPIFTKEPHHYAFIRNSGYKEDMFVVPLSSLLAGFTVNAKWQLG